MLRCRGESVGKWKAGRKQEQWEQELMAELWGSCGQSIRDWQGPAICVLALRLGEVEWALSYHGVGAVGWSLEEA